MALFPLRSCSEGTLMSFWNKGRSWDRKLFEEHSVLYISWRCVTHKRNVRTYCILLSSQQTDIYILFHVKKRHWHDSSWRAFVPSFFWRFVSFLPLSFPPPSALWRFQNALLFGCQRGWRSLKSKIKRGI